MSPRVPHTGSWLRAGKKPITGSIFAAVLYVQSGCAATQISLAPTIAAPAAPVRTGDHVAVAPRAEGLPDLIGYGTVTVLAIPASPVRFSGADGPERIMNGVREALRRAGYTVSMPADHPNAPVLTCRINEIDFSDYTWLGPTVRIWGYINLTLALMDPIGTLRWQKDYASQYAKSGVGTSFDTAVNAAMGEILARAAEDFTTADFRTACCSAPASAGAD
jgi:hypothetical protein